MKKYTLYPLIVFFGLIINSLQAQSVTTNAQTEKVQIYFNGAEIQQISKVQLPKGSSEVIITNIADELDQNSIRVKSVAGISVLSVQFSNKPTEGIELAAQQYNHSVGDSIKLLENQINTHNNLKISILKSIEILDENKKINNSNLNTAELSKWVDFYKTKHLELRNQLQSTENQIVKLNKNLQKLKNSQPQNLSKGYLTLQVMNENAGKIPFQLNYVTYKAHWKPFYEVRSEKLNAPISLKYNAEVMQNTGVHWNNITLSLSSGYINTQTDFPVMNTWFISAFQPVKKTQKTAKLAMMDTENPAFLVDKETGKIMEETNHEEPHFLEDTSLEEVVFAEETQLNTTFDIKLPYTISSNGKKHSVSLKNIEIPASYSYYSAPKYDSSAFLVGNIQDYGSYNLLSGNANLIFEGMYVGKTTINPEIATKEMRFSFGKDKKIGIERKLITQNTEYKTFNSKKVQHFTYEISVQNNKKEAVSITIEDQIPVSTDKNIKVSINESSNATFDSEKGILKWNLTLKPTENQKVRYSYQIESEKEITIY